MFSEVSSPVASMYRVRENMILEGRFRHLSEILAKANIGLRRVVFNSADKEHRMIFAKFLSGHGWKDGISFHVESPNLTVPSTVINKLLRKELRRELDVINSVDVHL